MSDIILKIKALLDKKNITIQDFAIKIDKTKQTVYNYFNGKTAIDVETLQKISEVLEVPITYFFGLQNETNTKGCEEVLKENEILKKEGEIFEKDIRSLENENRFLESERVHLIKELASSMFIRFVLNNFSFVPEGLKNEKRFDYLVNEISNKQNYIIHLNENLRMPKELKEEVIEQALYEYNQRNKDTIESYIAVYIGMRNGIKNEAKNDTK